MDTNLAHSWAVTPQEAIHIQKTLRAQVVRKGLLHTPRFIAGGDAAFGKDSNAIIVSVVLLAFPSLEIVERVVHRDVTAFPYVPGLLSFREAPALLKAFGKLKRTPDVVFIDGHGLAHPRAFGVACHVGVLLDRPTIGCAKSILIGSYTDLASSRSSVAYLRDKNNTIIGAAVRTRDAVRPVFVSIGHKITLRRAIDLVLSCGKGVRIPEPTRIADRLAGEAKRN